MTKTMQFFVFGLLATVASALPANTSSTSQDAHWGEIAAGIRISISLVNPLVVPDQYAEFLVTFQNVGEEDTAINLGSTLANGKAYLPDGLSLVLLSVRNGTTTERRLQFSHKTFGIVSGRIDDYIVSLPAGSSYTVKLSLRHYHSPSRLLSYLRILRGFSCKTYQ